MRFALLALLLGFAGPAWAQQRGGDPVIGRCEEVELRLRTLSAAAIVAVCEQMQRRLGPPLRASQLRDLATATADLAADGWMAPPGEIARQVVAVIALRGQEGQPRTWRTTAELLVRLHAETDAQVTPGHIGAALAEAGAAAQTLDDEGLRRLALSLRERLRRAAASARSP